MAKDKSWTKTMKGGQLVSAGELIDLMDKGSLLKCRVLACVATEDGGCLANLEVAEGDRSGERISTKLFATPREAVE